MTEFLQESNKAIGKQASTIMNGLNRHKSDRSLDNTCRSALYPGAEAPGKTSALRCPDIAGVHVILNPSLSEYAN